jgi:DNA polymerase-3 subunit gamma/tau
VSNPLQDSGPVTTWATVAIPGGGGAATAPQAAEAPAVHERPKLQAVPPLPKEEVRAEASAVSASVDDGWSPAAPAVDDEGWSTVAPSDDDAPSFEEDPDAGPGASATTAPAPSVPTPPRAEEGLDTVAERPTRPSAQAASSAAPRKGPSFAAAPSSQRYGEAVVREILNARFIEEQQLPENGGR